METMTVIVEVPEPLAGRLAAEAARRGVSVHEVAVEALEGFYGSISLKPDADGIDASEAFIGCADSDDPQWATRDIHELRAEAAARKIAEGA